MIYILTISTRPNLDLTRSPEPQLEQVVRRCLVGRSHTASQELAASWNQRGYRERRFPFGYGCREESGRLPAKREKKQRHRAQSG